MRSIIFIILVSFTMHSCKLNRIVADGNVLSVERTHDDFTAIEVSSGLNVSIRMADEYRVVVDASENIHKYIETSVNNGKLAVKIKANTSISGNSMIRVNVYATNIDELVALEGSSIIVENSLKSENLAVRLSEGSTLLGNIDCENFSGVVSAGGGANLRGRAANYSINLSGGSNAEGFGLEVDRLACDVSGGGVVSVTVHKRLDVVASGGSAVHYKGDGVVTSVDLSGGSKLLKK